MIKTILAFIGALAIVGACVFAIVERPWNKGADVVPAATASAPEVNFDALRDDGINVERAYIDAQKTKAVLYISYSKFFNAPVLLRAFDVKGKEIGRARRTISGDNEDAAYADFDFDARVPLRSVSFLILTKSQIVDAAEASVAEVVEQPAAPAPESTPAAPAPEAAPAPAEVPAGK